MGPRVGLLVAGAVLVGGALILIVTFDDDGSEGRPLTGDGTATMELVDPGNVDQRAPRSCTTEGQQDESPAEPAGAPARRAGDENVCRPGAGGTERFGVSVGAVPGLHPGAHVRVPVRYSNPHPFPISVSTVSASVTGTPTCPAQHLVTRRHYVDTPIHVGRRSSVASAVSIGMRPTAPDACQRAAFEVTVVATAMRS